MDPQQSSIDTSGPKIGLKDLYCSKCEKEHVKPQNFLQCNTTGHVILDSLRNFYTPGKTLLTMSPTVTNILFQGIVQITINNNYGNEDQNSTRDFGNYHDFPHLYADEELNRLCFRSLPGNMYEVGEFSIQLMEGCYIYLNGKWYGYTGKNWEEDFEPDDFIVKELVPVYKKLAGHFTKEMSKKWLRMLSSDLSNKGKRKQYVEEMEGLFKRKKGKSILLDAKPNLTGFQNGVYDSERCEFREHRANDYITRLLDYNLPAQSDPVVREDIETFFSDILPTKEVRRFMLLYLALHLEGRNRHQIIAILTGSGGNGKGMLKHLMALTFGHMHTEPSATFLTSERPSDEKPAPNIVDLRTKRSVYASEPEANKKINGGFIKFLSGNDRIKCRNCHSNEHVEFMPMFMVTLLCNVIPLIEGGDVDVRALWRRIKIIHFPNEFVDKEPEGPNQRKADTGLMDRMKMWRAEMMLMLIGIYEHYVRDGYKLMTPSEVDAKVEQEKEANNPIRGFAKAELQVMEANTVHVDHVKKAFMNFADQRVSTQWMIKQLQRLGYDIPEETGRASCCEGNKRYLVGYGLRNLGTSA